MVEQSCPELLAFQRNHKLLLNIRHDIKSIARKAFIAELIDTTLKAKCSDKSSTDEERTKCLLAAIEARISHLPETLQEFAKILNETSAFEYIAEKLLTSLEEIKKELGTEVI